MLRPFALALSLAGCAATRPASPAPPASPTPATSQSDTKILAELQAKAVAEATGQVGPTGATKDDPLPACGAGHSYVIVADLECADGSRPLDGDIPRAARSRRGNVGSNAAGHIIDRYELACPEGDRTVFVDMYGCETATPSRSERESHHYIENVFLAGDLVEFARRCDEEVARGPERVSVMIQTCAPVMPTVLRAQGKRKEGLDWLAGFCARIPPPTAEEPRRHEYLARVLAAHADLRARQGAAAADIAAEVARLTAEYAPVCGVEPAAYAAWAAANPEP